MGWRLCPIQAGACDPKSDGLCPIQKMVCALYGPLTVPLVCQALSPVCTRDCAKYWSGIVPQIGCGLCPIWAEDCALYGPGTVPHMGWKCCPKETRNCAPYEPGSVPHMGRGLCPMWTWNIAPYGLGMVPCMSCAPYEPGLRAVQTRLCAPSLRPCHEAKEGAGGGWQWADPIGEGGAAGRARRGGLYSNPVLDVPGNPPNAATQTALNPLAAPGPNGHG